MSDKEELKKKEEMSVRMALISIREKVLGEAKKCGRTRVVCSFCFFLLTTTENVVLQPDLVAVSKLKGTNLIQAAYDDGHRIFGENYVQEIVTKHLNYPKIFSGTSSEIFNPISAIR